MRHVNLKRQPKRDLAFYQLAGVQVLVIDDALEARAYISRILERHGAEVVAVASAFEARRALGVLVADAIVCDIAMPDEDGLQFLRRLRRDEEIIGRHIPALALTALADEPSHRQILKAGFHGHITKTQSADVLIEAIQKLILNHFIG